MKVLVPAPEAGAVSDALWGLRRPSAVREVKDTQYLFPWFEATDGSLWMMVDSEYVFDVDENADSDPIVAKLQPYEDAGALPAGTLATLKMRVEELRGGRMVVYDEFPALFKLPTADHSEGQARTLEELIAAGKFQQPGGRM